MERELRRGQFWERRGRGFVGTGQSTESGRVLEGTWGRGPRWKSGQGLRAENGMWKRTMGTNAEGAPETGRLPGLGENWGADARRRRHPSPGAAALMLVLPATMFHLLLVARSGPARLLGPPPYLPGPEALWSPRALQLVLAWLGLQAALYLLPARKVRTRLAAARGRRAEGGLGEMKALSTLIGAPLCPQVAEGQELKNKSRLRYPINGAWEMGGSFRPSGISPGPQALFCPGQTWGVSLSLSTPLSLHPPLPCPTAFAATLCTRAVAGVAF